MPSQTAIFTRSVRDHMRTKPPALPPACADAVAAMAAADATAIMVRETGGPLLGIVTERDIARRIAYRLSANAPLSDAMSSPVVTIDADDRLYRAIATMRRNSLKHMPVVDRNGEIIGMIELHRALAEASPEMLAQIDLMTHDRSEADLAKVKAAQVALAESLMEDAVPAGAVLSVISEVNADIHRRAAAITEDAMRDAGAGAAPVPFALIVMGSGGRGESLFGADQDNGLVLADYDDSDHDQVDAWFRGFSDHFTRTLDQIGLPLCKGSVMATNPVWRESIGQWRGQLAGWLRRRGPEALRCLDILADARGVWGETALADSLPALAAMHAIQSEHAIALGWFRRLRPRDDGPCGSPTINLKYGAMLPLVEPRAWRHLVPRSA